MVQSGPGGGYGLPVAEGDVVFITKPASYAVPLDKDNLPRFPYVHDPDGTPAELDYLRDDVVAELIGTDAAFGITEGDVICRRIRLMGCSESVTRNSSQTQQIRSSKRQRTTP